MIYFAHSTKIINMYPDEEVQLRHSLKHIIKKDHYVKQKQNFFNNAVMSNIITGIFNI